MLQTPTHAHPFTSFSGRTDGLSPVVVRGRFKEFATDTLSSSVPDLTDGVTPLTPKFYMPKVTSLLRTPSSFYLNHEAPTCATNTPAKFLRQETTKHSSSPSEKVAESPSADDDLRRACSILRRSQLENERLREQLKALSLRESLLLKRLQEACAERDRLQYRVDFKQDSVTDACASGVQGTPKSSTHMIQSLQVRICELQGRLTAYEERFHRSPVLEEEHQPSESPSLHDTLCQCVSVVEYLVKVFNAVNHFESVTHPSTQCPRSRSSCVIRCLQAAMKGNTEKVSEIVSRGYRLTDHQLGLLLREDLLYCETTAVRLAAHILQSCGSNDGIPTVLNGEEVYTGYSSVLHPVDECTQQRGGPTRSNDVSFGEQKKTPIRDEERPETVGAPACSSIARWNSKRQRQRSTRPTIEDCEMQ